MLGSLSNGPTFNSELGIVRLNGTPCCDVNVKSIVAGKLSISVHGRPNAPGSAANGLMSGEMSAFIAFAISVSKTMLDVPESKMMSRLVLRSVFVCPFTVICEAVAAQ